MFVTDYRYCFTQRQKVGSEEGIYVFLNDIYEGDGGYCIIQGSHRHWKTWKNETTFSSQGKVREF